MSFGVTDADLATSGYTYTVGYGYDVNNTVWYSTLSQALAANSVTPNDIAWLVTPVILATEDPALTGEFC